MTKKKIFDSLSQLHEAIPVRGIKEFRLEEGNVAVARTAEGVFAFHNECPHNKAKLSDGKCNWQQEVVCPWHNYRFDLVSGRECSGRSLKLKTYHVEISEEGVYLVL